MTCGIEVLNWIFLTQSGIIDLIHHLCYVPDQHCRHPLPPEMTIGGNNSFDSKIRLPRSYLFAYLLHLHLTFPRNFMLLQMTISSNIFLQQHPCGVAWQGGYPICKCHPIFIVSSHCCHWAFCHVPLQHLGIGWSASSHQPSTVRITAAVKPVWFDQFSARWIHIPLRDESLKKKNHNNSFYLDLSHNIFF